jgi:hypothetical protein
MVGASKRFTDPATYAFSLASYATFDGGQTWTETLLPLTDTDGHTYAGTSDPAVAWDNSGNAYVVGLPFGPGLSIIGITIYQSIDGGRTWGAPKLIHSSSGDDKQWATGDNNPASPHYGNVYAVWDDGSQMGFASYYRQRRDLEGIQIRRCRPASRHAATGHLRFLCSRD